MVAGNQLFFRCSKRMKTIYMDIQEQGKNLDSLKKMQLFKKKEEKKINTYFRNTSRRQMMIIRVS